MSNPIWAITRTVYFGRPPEIAAICYSEERAHLWKAFVEAQPSVNPYITPEVKLNKFTEEGLKRELKRQKEFVKSLFHKKDHGVALKQSRRDLSLLDWLSYLIKHPEGHPNRNPRYESFDLYTQDKDLEFQASNKRTRKEKSNYKKSKKRKRAKASHPQGTASSQPVSS